ncbi:MAG: hypothetical protein FJ033_04170 [Chloroflexi bacterium]|nr:hypothetical protein [Chloroflexota bacterium]
MPPIGMEDIRIPTALAAVLVIVLVYVLLIAAARKDDDQICPVCGDRRDTAPVEPWHPDARYCATCNRVTRRGDVAGEAGAASR